MAILTSKPIFNTGPFVVDGEQHTNGALDEVELDSFSGGDLTTGAARRRVGVMAFQ